MNIQKSSTTTVAATSSTALVKKSHNQLISNDTDNYYYTKCAVCNQSEKLLRCARCKIVYYCSKEHQFKDWQYHKTICKKYSMDVIETKKLLSNHKIPIDKHLNIESISTSTSSSSTSTSSSSSSATTSTSSNGCYESKTSQLVFTNNNLDGITSMTPNGTTNSEHTTIQSEMHYFPEVTLSNLTDTYEYDIGKDELCRSIIRDLDKFGFCAIDNFLGDDIGKQVLNEVLLIKDKGVLKDGQLVSTNGKDLVKTIRSDIICWVDGKKIDCKYIGILMENVDRLVKRANRMVNNGTLGQYNIKERTEAMVACYPGSGAHYVRHVDNPNGDGRCITAIYYLNLDWEVNKSGGLLRIFPKHCQLEKKVADVAPIFDRLLLFWSDRRNPHEVQPAFDTRYAITLWYFDSTERQEARNRGLAPRVSSTHTT